MSHELETTQKELRPNKHHHHGVGAANPSSGVDLINTCRWRGGRPFAKKKSNAPIKGFK